jgi:glycosyltransferase involved in cell wall biosynthesis
MYKETVQFPPGLRVCQAATVPYQLEVFFWPQIAGLQKSGVCTILVCNQDKSLAQRAHDAGATIVQLSMYKRFSPASDIQNTVRMIWALRDQGIDVTHSISSKCGFLMAITSWLLRIPVRIHTFAGLPWVTMHGIGRRIAIWCDGLIVLLNTECWADSASQKTVLTNEVPLARKKVVVHGEGGVCGVSLTQFDRALAPAWRQEVRSELQIPDNEPVLIFAGRLTREKGIRDLWAAFQAASARNPEIWLLIIGEEDVDTDPVDPVVMSGLRTSSQVRMLGFKHCPERYFAAADILVIPSYREGFCNVVIEAGALGIPAIGYRTVGLIDSIRAGETGVLVPLYDSNAFGIEITRLVRDKAVRKSLGDAARQRVVEHFNQRVVVSRILKRYLELWKAEANVVV